MPPVPYRSLWPNHLATVELLDATSIRVAQRTGQAAEALASIDVREHVSLLVEFQGNSEQELTDLAASAAPMFDALPVVSPVEMTSKLSERNALLGCTARAVHHGRRQPPNRHERTA